VATSVETRRGCRWVILRGVRTTSRGSRQWRARQRMDHERSWPMRGADEHPGRARNAANPRIGSGMQQACESSGGETGEVVRNGEVGTGSRGWHLTTPAAAAMSTSGTRTPRDDVDGGVAGPAHERHYGSDVGGGGMAPGRIPGEEVGSPDPGIGTRTLEGSEAHEGRTMRRGPRGTRRNDGEEVGRLEGPSG
jgi:hypothetical protein